MCVCVCVCVCSLSDVSLDVAVSSGRGETAYNVEQCQCPVNYVGSSCERCADGYYRSKEGPYLGTCVPCQCHDRADRCDPHSGACIVSTTPQTSSCTLHSFTRLRNDLYTVSSGTLNPTIPYHTFIDSLTHSLAGSKPMHKR